MIRASPKAVDHNSAKLCSSIKTDEMLRTNTPFLRQFASHSLLIPWQTSPYPLYKGVLSYPPPSKGGIIRASPGCYNLKECQDMSIVYCATTFPSLYTASINTQDPGRGLVLKMTRLLNLTESRFRRYSANLPAKRIAPVLDSVIRYRNGWSA